MISFGGLPTAYVDFYLITNETANLSEFPWFSGIFGEYFWSH